MTFRWKNEFHQGILLLRYVSEFIIQIDEVGFSGENDWIAVNNQSIQSVCEKLKVAQTYPIQIQFANPY